MLCITYASNISNMINWDGAMALSFRFESEHPWKTTSSVWADSGLGTSAPAMQVSLVARHRSPLLRKTQRSSPEIIMVNGMYSGPPTVNRPSNSQWLRNQISSTRNFQHISDISTALGTGNSTRPYATRPYANAKTSRSRSPVKRPKKQHLSVTLSPN